MKRFILLQAGALALALMVCSGFSSNATAQNYLPGKWVVDEMQDMGKNNGESVELFGGWVKGMKISFTPDSMVVHEPLGERQYGYRSGRSELQVTADETRVLGVEIGRSERKKMETMHIPFTFENGKLILGSDAMGKRAVLRRAS
jgi:hypothetical protein